jgi:hypothetical protein
MPVDLMFVLATAAFAWGLSLATYRWFATQNDWPMGEWQAHRPGLPIAFGLMAIAVAMLFALARGGATLVVVPLFGLLCAWAWTALTKVGAQSALLLAPAAIVALMAVWISATEHLEPLDARDGRTSFPTRLEQDRLIHEQDRAIRTDGMPTGVNRPQSQR